MGDIGKLTHRFVPKSPTFHKRIFKKFREFQTRKNVLQEVFTMCKGTQDIGPFLVVGNQTNQKGIYIATIGKEYSPIQSSVIL